MEHAERKRINIFDYQYIRWGYLLLAALKISPLLSPYVGPLFKVVLVYACILLVYDLFQKQLFLRNKWKGILVLFFLCNTITIFINRSDELMENLQNAAYMMIQFFVLAAYDGRKDPQKVQKEISVFNTIFIVCSFIGALGSLVIYFGDLEFSVLSETNMDYVHSFGYIDQRLWGFYSNPNTGAFVSASSIILSLINFNFCNAGQKNIRQLYGINIALQFLLMALYDSRGASVLLVVFLVIFYTFKWKAWLETNKQMRGKGKPFVVGGAFALAICCIVFWGMKGIKIGLTYLDSLSGTQHAYSFEEVVESAQREDVSGGDSSNGRMEIWMAGLEKATHSDFLFGVGNANCEEKALPYQPLWRQRAFIGGSFHNTYVTTLVSSGAIGVLLIAWLYVSFCWTGARRLFAMREFSAQNAWSCALVAYIVAMMIHGAIETTMLYNTGYFGVLFWSYFGYAGYHLEKDGQRVDFPTRVTRKIADRIGRNKDQDNATS